jgi:hypothetical protein
MIDSIVDSRTVAMCMNSGRKFKSHFLLTKGELNKPGRKPIYNNCKIHVSELENRQTISSDRMRKPEKTEFLRRLNENQ